MPSMIRYCPQCDLDKDELEFYKKNDRASGRSSWCAECLREYQNQGKWVRRRRELRLKYQEKRREQAPAAPESPSDAFFEGNGMSDYFSTFKPPVIAPRPEENA